jgi:hypothetical protein
MVKNCLMRFVGKIFWPYRQRNVITDIRLEKYAAENVLFSFNVSRSTKSAYLGNVLVILAMRLLSRPLTIPAHFFRSGHILNGLRRISTRITHSEVLYSVRDFLV